MHRNTALQTDAAQARAAGPVKDMQVADLKAELIRWLGEVPVGPHSKTRLVKCVANMRSGDILKIVLRRPRRASLVTGLHLKKAARGLAWSAGNDTSPLAGGFLIDKIDTGSPAAREVEGGRLDLSDIVVRIDDVHLVGKSGTDKAMRTVNKFKEDGQTIDLWIWHRTENDGEE